ncbi:MAG: cytochrome c biogenesis protein CcsA [Actinomycetota bacterium]
MTTSEVAPEAAPSGAEPPPHTGSAATRRLGFFAAVAVALMLFFGLYISGPEVTQGEAVRLFYIHVPTIAAAYLGFFVTLVGSVIYLRTRSQFWDLLAASSAELGVLFCTFLLVSGALWGKPTWGVYWQWDPRLTSTAVLYVTYIGYLALRRMELPPEVRSRRAAILGVISFANVIVVHYSVQWWRGLHQGSTLGIDSEIGGMQYFSFFLGLIAMLLVYAWLLLHRFRVAWLSQQIEELGLARALAERRAETDNGGAF